MFELLFLLLPIAVAYGWYMGKREARRKYQDLSDKMIREYVSGLNYLFTNQKEKAVDHFMDLINDDNGSIETYLTLGNLFRSRGETDRAIRIHQSLVESSSLTDEQHLLSMQELGRDYMLSGLYDRAEDIFMQLIDDDEYKKFSLQQLLIIYQSTSDWINAIESASRLVKLGETTYNVVIAQFYCELAAQAIANERYDEAIFYTKKALFINSDCVRASILIGRVYLFKQHYQESLNYLVHTLQQNPIFVGEALNDIYECYIKLNDEKGLKHFLKQCVYADVDHRAELMLADVIERQNGQELAQQFLSRELIQKPNLLVFHRLMDYHLHTAEEGKAKESLSLLRNMVGMQMKNNPNYRCEKCGFTLKTLYWLCPSCRNWETIKPIKELQIK